MFRKTGRKTALISVPILGSLSIIGTGFCMWTFVDENAKLNDEALIPVKVSSEVENGVFNLNSLSTKGDIDLAKKGYLFPRMLVFGEGDSYHGDLTKGLNFYKKVDNYIAKPGLPEFEDQPYLASETLVTYYRDATIPLADLQKQGLTLSLKVKIGITEQLSNIVTILDSFKAEGPVRVIEQDIVNPDLPSPVDYYVFDYTNKIASYPKVKLYDEANNINVPTYPDITIEEKQKTYEKYDFHMSFGNIFRYKNHEAKPDSLTKYINLYNNLHKDGQPQQCLSFQFFAEYIDYIPA